MKNELIFVLNGREVAVEVKKLSFEQIVTMALNEYDSSENVIYTVNYSKGNNPDKGSIVRGDVITVKKGMVINVTKTNRS